MEKWRFGEKMIWFWEETFTQTIMLSAMFANVRNVFTARGNTETQRPNTQLSPEDYQALIRRSRDYIRRFLGKRGREVRRMTEEEVLSYMVEKVKDEREVTAQLRQQMESPEGRNKALMWYLIYRQQWRDYTDVVFYGEINGDFEDEVSSDEEGEEVQPLIQENQENQGISIQEFREKFIKIMSIVDEEKDNIKEGNYLELSNLLKEVYPF